jgi:hypothetical protein
MSPKALSGIGAPHALGGPLSFVAIIHKQDIDLRCPGLKMARKEVSEVCTQLRSFASEDFAARLLSPQTRLAKQRKPSIHGRQQSFILAVQMPLSSDGLDLLEMELSDGILVGQSSQCI